jgi:nicotinamidase-related amidase
MAMPTAREQTLSAPAARLHDWRIEEREYARQERRRGRRHAYETLHPARTALVVADMIPFFVRDSGYCAGIVPNIDRLASALRDACGTIAWVLPAPLGPDSGSDFYGPATAQLYRESGGDGPLPARLWPGLRPHPADLFVEKTAASAFFPGRCQLPSLLAGREVDTVLITGTVTNVCCESSARDASTLGFRTIMVADANAARRDQDHNATLHTIYRTFGDVRPAAEVLAMIRAAPG